MFVSNLAFMSIWSRTAEAGAKRLREKYFASVLRQDVPFFDNVGAGEIATRIETDTREYLHSSYPNFLFISSSRPRPARYFRKGRLGHQFLGRFLHRFYPRLYQAMETHTRHVFHYPHDFRHFCSHE